MSLKPSMGDFHGAKAALFAPGGLVVIRRDDIATIPWSGRVDLPGGGREYGESPVDCVRREVHEELGLNLRADRFHWGQAFVSQGGCSWLFSADITAAEVSAIRFSDEGQGWWIDPVAQYLARKDAIPHQQARLRICIAGGKSTQ